MLPRRSPPRYDDRRMIAIAARIGRRVIAIAAPSTRRTTMAGAP